MDKFTTQVIELPDCDICKLHNQKEILKAQYDCKTNQGFWASLCKQHYQQYGIGLGLCKGQELKLV